MKGVSQPTAAGSRDWASLEGRFDLTATHDGLGHIPVRVRLRSGPYDDDWRLEGVIWLEAGGLDTVARAAARFEAAKAT